MLKGEELRADSGKFTPWSLLRIYILRGGVAKPGWLCLPSTLADAISNCYGEKPCWHFIVSECSWRVGKERTVCAWSSVVTMCFGELGHSKHG